MNHKIHNGNDLFKMIFCSLLFLSLISFASASFGYGNINTSTKYGYGNIFTTSPQVNNYNNTYTNVTNGTDSFAGNFSNFSSVYAIGTNGTFYLASNPSSFITASSLSPYLLITNWNSTNSSYNTFLTNNTFLQISNWNSTNSSYNTAFFLATNNTFMKFSDWNSTNSSYLTSETYWNGNWSAFKTINQSVTNNTFLQISNFNVTNSSYLTSYTETDPKWTANYSGFLTTQNYALNWNNNWTWFKTINTTISNGTFAQLVSTSNPTTANFTGNLSVFQNFTVDSGTFFVDALHNYIGVNLSTPQNALNVFGDANITGTIYTNFNQNLTIPYLLATNNTFAQLTTLNNGTYTTWANIFNGTIATNGTQNNFSVAGINTNSIRINGTNGNQSAKYNLHVNGSAGKICWINYTGGLFNWSDCPQG